MLYNFRNQVSRFYMVQKIFLMIHNILKLCCLDMLGEIFHKAQIKAVSWAVWVY